MIEYYSETQRWSKLLSIAILSGSVVFAGLILFLCFGDGAEPSLIWTLWGLWVMVTLFDAFIAGISLVTKVHSQGITAYFRPLRFPSKTFTWPEIETAYARPYSPVKEYGGWGIRFGKSGRAYNIKGNQGIQLVLKDGKKFLIGTQQPGTFIQAVRSAGGPVGKPNEGK